jgi:hypothetical protein
MREELPADDPKKVWQAQPAEANVMTLKLIQSKARELQSQTRRKLIGLALVPLGTVLLYAYGIREFASFGQVLHPLFAGALLWSLAGIYVMNRGMWAAAMPGDAGPSTGLQFWREEIGRRRTLLRRVLLWSLGPLLLAIATFVLGLALVSTRERGLIPNGIPFLALVCAWIFSYFVVRDRELRKLGREMDELNELDTGNRG